ncbi:hypothetical protein CYMTET_14290 [Cymbomonas tetramitiformis]|uniref:Uncharacterized protein n=1 Tax=Cymbomonas tetramitiformis TaxID=36881 RepID=A0AAE0GGS4_9CHLO|nr:hypothetical protein CYMTET_27331 [Cymbomonas tetramitiformis]KAK3277707.1 hypothetical protein CYMTET_14290 [Cymbomonas tetramitiformis]
MPRQPSPHPRNIFSKFVAQNLQSDYKGYIATEKTNSFETPFTIELAALERSATRAVETSGSKRLLTNRLDLFVQKKRRGVNANSGDDGAIPGDAYVRELCRMLDVMGLERTTSQKTFHKAFLRATLAHIYGSADFERHRTRILSRYGISAPQYEVLIVTPRRWGKTTSVGMFVAAPLLSTPEMWVSIFSTGQRASSGLLDMVYKMVCAVPGGSARVARKNQEQLFIKGDEVSDVRRLYSYPSSVQGVVATTPRSRLEFLAVFSFQCTAVRIAITATPASLVTL